MTTPTPVQQAEALWVRAHESVRRGDFAAAVRDLAACFKLLQAASDPRLPEVHRRWTEVHQLALEDAAQGRAAPAAAAAATPAPSLEAEAEAAANAGNLEEAITLYERALQKRPDNELVSERLTELKNARPRAAELGVTSTAPAPAVAVSHEPVAETVVEPVVEPVVETFAAAVVITPTVDVLIAAAAAAEEAVRAPVDVPATPINEEAIAASIDLDFDIDSGPRAPAPGPSAQDRVGFGFDASAGADPVADPVADAVADIHTAATLVPAPAQPAVVDAQPTWSAASAASAAAEDDEISFADTMPRNQAVPTPAPAEAVAVAFSSDDMDDAAFGLAVGAAVEEPVAQPIATVVETAVVETAVVETAVVETAVVETAIVETAIVETAVVATAVIEVDDTVSTAKIERPQFSAVAGTVASTMESGPEPTPPLAGPGSEEEPIGLPANHLAVDSVTNVDTNTVNTVDTVPTVPTVAGDSTVHTRDTADLTVDDFTAAAAAQDAARAPEPREAPPMAADDAPVGMPSIDVDIDMGGSVSADEAGDMPVSADDLIMVGDDMSVEPILSMPPQDAIEDGPSDAPSDEPSDPVELLETLLQRVRQNRRAA